MIIVKTWEEVHSFPQGCVAALGTFDGLHLGHRQVIEKARELAKEKGCLLAVFTFSNHPLDHLRPGRAPKLLLTTAAKEKMLENLGVELLLEFPFDKELLSLSPAAFTERLSKLDLKAIVVGENFTYGSRGAGTPATLAKEAREQGYELSVQPLLQVDGMTVSSTAIRRLLAQGEAEEANKLLGYRYTLTGKVEHGQERGRLLGFPTANIVLQKSRLALPAAGAYAAEIKLSDGRKFFGMANIGRNPTFDDVEELRLETHIFDFKEDIYGQQLEVAFIARLRGEMKFANVAALKRQLEKDRDACKKLLR